jgi:LysM repeat protein
MMFRDEKTETQHKRLPDDEPAVPAEPATSGESAVPEYLEGVRQPHPQEPRPQEPRPQEPRREELPLLRPGTMKPQSAPRPLQISNGTRRVPTYPAWEKPPSAFEYPRLRSQEVHRPVKPLAIAAVGMVLIAAVVLAFSALTGHGAVANASGSNKPSAGLSGSASHGPNSSGSLRPSPTASSTASQGTPGPQISFQQYKVLAGESATKIAVEFHLKTWEFLAANPQLTAPNYTLKVGSWVNIPLPGQMVPPTPTPVPTPAPTPTPTPAGP